jgi:hypothetical protein
MKWQAGDRLRKLWSKALGMRLAVWLEKKHPDWCWADLCSKLGFGYQISWLWKTTSAEKSAETGAVCWSEEAQKVGYCWCGKFMTPEFRRRMESDQKEPGGFDL